MDAFFEVLPQNINNDAFWEEKRRHNEIMEEKCEVVRRKGFNCIPLHK